MHSYQEALGASLEYFGGDELAAKVFVDKYALRTVDNELMELTPEEMHRRISRALYEVEVRKFGDDALSEQTIFDALDRFRYIVPQGGCMAGIGSPSFVTLSNCYVVDPPEDSYGGIMWTDEQIVQISKRRGGCGVDISRLRPKGAVTHNSSRTSTGPVCFADRFSHSIREVGQCLFEKSLVLTKQGLQYIKDTRIGDYVWTQKGWIKVVNKYNNGTKQLQTITTKMGYTVSASKDHIFLVVENDSLIEKRLEDIRVEDKIVLIPGETYDNDNINLEHHEYHLRSASGKSSYIDSKLPRALTKELAYLLGYSYGDGHFTYDKYKEAEALHLSCATVDKNTKQRLVDYIKTVFDITPKVKNGSGAVELITIPGKKICSWLKHNKINKEKSAHIKMPDKILFSNSEIQLAFIAGFFDADGTIEANGKNVRFGSCSKDFIDVIQLLLMANGITSKKQKLIPKATNELPQHRLNITGTYAQKRFKDLVDAIKLRSMNKVSSQDHVLTPYKYFNVGMNTGLLQRKYTNCPSSKNQFFSVTALHTLIKDNVFDKHIIVMDEVKNISEHDMGNTYDLELAEENLFWCNGFYVHNSGRRGALLLSMSVHHPDIIDFIESKKDRTRLTGTNLSVRLSDEFLRAVRDNTTYQQRWPVDSDEPKISREVCASDVWSAITKNAHEHAEPGVLFWNKIISESPADCYKEFQTAGVNPCCFDVDSQVMVVTDGGIKEIKDITDKDKVWINETGEFVNNSGYFRAGKSDVYEVEFTNGETLVVTGNHKLCKAKQKREGTKLKYYEAQQGTRVDELKVGDKIIIQTTDCHEHIYHGKNSYEEGLILGWLAGDGCLSYDDEAAHYPTMYLDFWQDDCDIIPHMVAALDKFGYQYDDTQRKNWDYKHRIQCREFVQKWTEYTQENIWQFRAHNGSLSYLYKSSVDFIRGFISAYFSADGTVCYNPQASGYSLSLSSINKDRLHQISYILGTFGIKSYVSLLRKAGHTDFNDGYGPYKTSSCWRLIITGIDNIKQFNEYFQLYPQNKARDIQAICSLEPSRTNKSANYTKIKDIRHAGQKEVGCIDVEQYHKFTANNIISFNSELSLSILDSCRLLLINAFSFVEEPFSRKPVFNWRKFYEYARIAQRLMDDIIDLELAAIERIIIKIQNDDEPSELKQRELDMWRRIHHNCETGRRTGTGITALADTLAALNLPYCGKKSLAFVDRLYKTLKFGCYTSSIDMAKIVGPFSIWNAANETQCPFFLRFAEETCDLGDVVISGADVMKDMRKYGRRNIGLLTSSPAGSTSLETQTSSGIEPVFALSATRRKKGNPTDEDFRVDFVDANGDHWMEFTVLHPKLKVWCEVTGEQDITKSPWHGSCAKDLDYTYRVKLQATAQRHIDHSISSTINLPADATVEQIQEIYMLAWQLGCKGVTVYRDGCRDGVILDKSGVDKQKSCDTIQDKRPRVLPCDVHHTSVQGQSYFVLVGLLDGKPYEVFAGKNGFIPTKVKSGTITRKRKNFYVARFDDTDDELSPITAATTEMEEMITRLTSLGLRYGADMHKVVQQLEKVGERKAMNSFARGVARVLKKYIEDGTSENEQCPECKSDMIRQEGCVKCTSCAWTRCL